VLRRTAETLGGGGAAREDLLGTAAAAAIVLPFPRIPARFNPVYDCWLKDWRPDEAAETTDMAINVLHTESTFSRLFHQSGKRRIFLLLRVHFMISSKNRMYSSN
jgi:hypothetical protein